MGEHSSDHMSDDMSDDMSSPSAPPARALLQAEWRAFAELGAFWSMLPLLRLLPRGDGHPVLVLPGLAAGDASTAPLRAFLRDRGWRAHGWRLGTNWGPRPGVEQAMHARLADLHARCGAKVSVIGWSLGGIYARELARRSPERVRAVITLGSPFAGDPRASHARHLYEFVSGRRADAGHPWRARMPEPPPVPATAIYSRSDGVVAWQGCREREAPHTENIEVEGSHGGLGHNPVVLHAIADRLAQPEGGWRPFERRGLRRFVYPDPNRDRRAAA